MTDSITPNQAEINEQMRHDLHYVQALEMWAALIIRRAQTQTIQVDDLPSEIGVITR